MVSLRDPLTLAMIEVPVRLSSCTHTATFFDLATFLNNAKWKCPICGEKGTGAYEDDIRVNRDLLTFIRGVNLRPNAGSAAEEDIL